MALTAAPNLDVSAAGTDAPQRARLYPPRVNPPADRLPIWRFVPAFVRNPLEVMPAAVYTEPMVRFDQSVAPTIYVTAPALVKDILLDRRELFARTRVEKRILGGLLGNGVLTADGADWKWQRQTAAPLFRHQDLLGFVPAIVKAADMQAAVWRRAAPGATPRLAARSTDATGTGFHACPGRIPGG